MATALSVYGQVLGEGLQGRAVDGASLGERRIADLRDAALEVYSEPASPRPLEPGELRPCVDLPDPIRLTPPSREALASVLDPLALRRELMAEPLKLALLAGTRVTLVDPVARLTAPGAQTVEPDQIRAALGLLARLSPLIKEGVILLAGPRLAEAVTAEPSDMPDLAAAAHWAVDAARLRARPGRRALRATRDLALDRFAMATEASRLLAGLEALHAEGAPAHACFRSRSAETLGAPILADALWALAHYELGDIDRSLFQEAEPELIAERRRDGSEDLAEPIAEGKDLPYGHVARLSATAFPSAAALGLDDIVAMRRGEEVYEEWRHLLADWLKAATAAAGEMADPRPLTIEWAEQIDEWNRRGRERLSRGSLSAAFERAQEEGRGVAVGAALSERPDALGAAAASGGRLLLDRALVRALLGRNTEAEGDQKPAPTPVGAYLAMTRRAKPDGV